MRNNRLLWQGKEILLILEIHLAHQFPKLGIKLALQLLVANGILTRP
jgi:hypothetical protein